MKTCLYVVRNHTAVWLLTFWCPAWNPVRCFCLCAPVWVIQYLSWRAIKQTYWTEWLFHPGSYRLKQVHLFQHVYSPLRNNRKYRVQSVPLEFDRDNTTTNRNGAHTIVCDMRGEASPARTNLLNCDPVMLSCGCAQSAVFLVPKRVRTAFSCCISPAAWIKPLCIWRTSGSSPERCALMSPLRAHCAPHPDQTLLFANVETSRETPALRTVSL